MNKRFIALAIFICALLAFFILFLRPSYKGTILSAAKPAPVKTLLLIPLDSRPPCTQFVIDAAKIDNINVITPPTEILDYYYQESNTSAVADWLKNNLKMADAAIISIDQLLHGGLIASREGSKTIADSQKILALLAELHRQNPQIPIYAFNILPRITPPPSIGGYSLWKDFIEYSRLTDKLSLKYDPADTDRLSQLKSELPGNDLARYHSLFDKNAELNRSLSLLVKNGTLKMLVIGQDDGEKYGIPNLKKRELQAFLKENSINQNEVFITHGADEIALSLLAKISAERHAFRPEIFVKYNDGSTPNFIMPFMAGTVADTVQEKLQFLNATESASPEAADFTFFVSCNDSLTLATRKPSADYIKSLINKGQSVALTDLSEHFLAEETVFPFLVKNNTPLNSLIAYSGWNTTSNSIGTAISQAVIFSAAKKDIVKKQAVINLYRNNLTFLNNRFLEDYCFLKDIIDRVNFQLIKAGYTNVGDLDLEHNYRFANAMLQNSLAERFSRLKETRAFRAPVKIESPSGNIRLRVKDLSIDSCFPWPRTFEIYLRTTLTIEELSY